MPPQDKKHYYFKFLSDDEGIHAHALYGLGYFIFSQKILLVTMQITKVSF